MAHYSVARRYRSKLYTYRGVVSAVDNLDRMQLIDHDKRAPGQLGWQSAARARPELIAKTNAILAEGPPLKLLMPRETIVLRDANKEPTDYRDTPQTMQMRKKLAPINEAITSAKISGNAAAPVTRIFHETFERGGRFYAAGGAWQSMKKECRQRLTIDGESVAELDFKNLHAVLLYAEAGETPPADSYAIAPWPRALVKLGFLVMVNAKSRQAAKLKLANDERMAEIAPPGSQEALAAADRLITAIKHVHAPIAQYFHSDASARLMAQDAAIAERVMLAMLRQNAIAMPIHDSFLTPRSKAELLKEAMLKAAHEEAGLAAEITYS
jgi:hypothetical protein